MMVTNSPRHGSHNLPQLLCCSDKSGACLLLDENVWVQVVAPFPGHVWDLSCQVGDFIAVGDQLFTLEAMKMETPVLAAVKGSCP